MKVIYLILSITILLVVLIVPFELSSTNQETLNVVTNLISAICTLITLAIALYLYDKYGLRKSTKENQAAVVLNLIQDLKSVSFSIESNGAYLFYWPVRDINKPPFFEDYYQILLSFNDNYWLEMKKIFSSAGNLHMPPNIVNKVYKLIPSTLIHDIDGKENYAKVVIARMGYKDERFGRLNGKDITLIEYQSLWQELIDEANDWFEKNDIPSKELNLDY